ncbi:unnamed protein product, partial [Meganyctiphanes norvegica]
IGTMRHLLLLLALAHTGSAVYFCFFCGNWPETNTWYDTECGQDNYTGVWWSWPSEMTCSTEVFYDGSEHVERGYTSNSVEDGKCEDTGVSIKCYCKGDICNKHLCQDCSI